jgi:hypothetical protein
MTRQTGENIDNANMGTEANIAGLKQQGKLAGAAGLSTADQIEAAMKEAGLAGLSDADKMHLASLTGGSSLYSATPGLVSTFGNQVLQNSGQGLQGAGLQNDVSNSYLQNLLNKRLIPGDFSQAMGKIGQILSVGGAIPGVVKGFGKGA